MGNIQRERYETKYEEDIGVWGKPSIFCLDHHDLYCGDI
jgi:hypothetical protein